MTYTYNWELPECDEHGLKKRPPNALGVTAPPRPYDPDKKTRNRAPVNDKPIKNYDRRALVEDLRSGTMTQQAIADRYNLSRIRVIEIAKQEGLTRKQRV